MISFFTLCRAWLVLFGLARLLLNLIQLYGASNLPEMRLTRVLLASLYLNR